MGGAVECRLVLCRVGRVRAGGGGGVDDDETRKGGDASDDRLASRRRRRRRRHPAQGCDTDRVGAGHDGIGQRRRRQRPCPPGRCHPWALDRRERKSASAGRMDVRGPGADGDRHGARPPRQSGRLSAVYEESLGRILTGSGGDGRRGPWRNNRGANGGFSTTEISILLWVQARLYLMPNRRDVTPHFPAPPCTRCCDGWTPAPGRTQQRARGGAGKRGVRCFFFTGLGKGDDPMEGGRGVVPPQHCGGIY